MKTIALVILTCLLPTIAPARADTIKIGVIAAFSGPRAEGGAYTRNALSLAKQKIDADSSRKHKLDFFFEDSRYTPMLAVTAYHKLKNVDQVGYIIGAQGSSETLAIAPLAERAKTLVIAPGAQSDEVSQAGDYIFRLMHNTAQEGPFFASFVAERMKDDTLHLIMLDNAGGRSYLKSFIPALEHTGRKVGNVEIFSPEDTDMKAQLIRIKSKNPTDILAGGTPINEAIILKQATQLGMKVQFFGIGIEGPELLNVPEHITDGLIYAYSYDAEGNDPNVKSFTETYKQAYRESPDAIAANSYDAAMLLSDCFEKYGDQVDLVKKCLYDVKDYHGASGVFSIDENGDAIKKLFVKTIKNGKFERLE